MGPRARTAAALAALAAAAAGGCGGGERQDADEPAGDYRLEVVEARFPRSQTLAEDAVLTIAVRNADAEAVPNVAVTVETVPGRDGSAPVAFGREAGDPALADGARPVWIVDQGPRGGDAAYVNTWALGRLGPGRTARFEWRLTAVRPGRYTLAYRVAPGLDGSSRLAPGSRGAQGTFTVAIAGAPREVRVGEDGAFVSG